MFSGTPKFVGYNVFCTYVQITTHRPATNPSTGRNVALYAIFALSRIQYPR